MKSEAVDKVKCQQPCFLSYNKILINLNKYTLNHIKNAIIYYKLIKKSIYIKKPIFAKNSKIGLSTL